MEKVRISLDITKKALQTLVSIQNEPYNEIVRDATIQRFEYTCDLIWKLLKVYLESEGIVCNSPKKCFREAFHIGLLSEEETILGLEMIDDRNMTSHIYKEEVAISIFKKIESYTRLIESIVDSIEWQIINTDKYNFN